MNTVLVSFLKKTAYAVIANLVAMAAFGLSGFSASGDPLVLQVYAAVAALLTGAVAAVKRWADTNLAN